MFSMIRYFIYVTNNASFFDTLGATSLLLLKMKYVGQGAYSICSFDETVALKIHRVKNER